MKLKMKNGVYITVRPSAITGIAPHSDMSTQLSNSLISADLFMGALMIPIVEKKEKIEEVLNELVGSKIKAAR